MKLFKGVLAALVFVILIAVSCYWSILTTDDRAP